MGGATRVQGGRPATRRISIHAPRGGSDRRHWSWISQPMISIHAPRGGSDRQRIRLPGQLWHFNPRSPWGERPVTTRTTTPSSGFQSTLPVGGATVNGISVLSYASISIHAPRGGSDRDQLIREPFCRISIHAPRGGSDKRDGRGRQRAEDFNPRSPWGERHGSPRTNGHAADFNPRSPWGERHYLGSYLCRHWFISIHAPRGGSDRIR